MASLLEEKDAIRDLMYRYCFVSDREADPDGWAALFTEDGIWDGAEFGRIQGHAALRDFMIKATSGGGAGFRHNMANMLIDVDGDTAQARSYFLLMQKGKDGLKPFYAGYYEDKFVKQGGQWLFSERITCPE
jgi:ketosteroid isomerase-like protein